MVRSLVGVFGFFLLENPLKSIVLPNMKKSRLIFTPSRLNVLCAQHKDDPGMITYLALGIFAGIRPDEIMRLEWKDIRPDGILVECRKSKTRQRRFVKVTDNLSAWLIPRGFTAH